MHDGCFIICVVLLDNSVHCPNERQWDTIFSSFSGKTWWILIIVCARSELSLVKWLLLLKPCLSSVQKACLVDFIYLFTHLINGLQVFDYHVFCGSEGWGVYPVLSQTYECHHSNTVQYELHQQQPGRTHRWSLQPQWGRRPQGQKRQIQKVRTNIHRTKVLQELFKRAGYLLALTCQYFTGKHYIKLSLLSIFYI